MKYPPIIDKEKEEESKSYETNIKHDSASAWREINSDICYTTKDSYNTESIDTTDENSIQTTNSRKSQSTTINTFETPASSTYDCGGGTHLVLPKDTRYYKQCGSIIEYNVCNANDVQSSLDYISFDDSAIPSSHSNTPYLTSGNEMKKVM